jgi:hypothetical protein
MTRMRAIAFITVLTAASVSSLTPATAAGGGSTISSSPRLAWGQHQHGIGTHYLTPHPGDGRTFWHVHVRPGERITITLKVASTNGCATNQIQMFAPSVTDRTISSASPVDAKYVGHGQACFKRNEAPRRITHWQIRSVPFRGRATLWAGISSEAPTFSFVAHVHHAKDRKPQHTACVDQRC